MSIERVLERIVDCVSGFPHEVTDAGVIVYSKGDYSNVPRGEFIGLVRPTDGGYPEINKFGSKVPKLYEDIEAALIAGDFRRVSIVSVAA